MDELSQKLDDAEEFSHGTDHPGANTQVGLAAAEKMYFVEAIRAEDIHDDHPVLAPWRTFLSQGGSPEKLYQSPQFFRYALSEEQEDAKSLMLYVVRRKTDQACIGIIPTRKIDRDLAFAFGPVKFFTRKLRALQIMGSVPLLDRSASALPGYVFNHLLNAHPDCQVLSMQAVPADEVSALEALPQVSAYVQNGLRDCHTVPLPQDFTTYLQKFSSKKRYNLSRQVRLLGEQAGEVQLCRIEAASQVPMLIEAMRAVLPPHQSKEFARQTRLEQLAEHGILHSYVVRCGSEDVGFVFATRSDEVWHVHKIAALAKYQGISAGTSTVHLALEDVITHFSLNHADFGYGTPNQEFRATHVQKARAFVLLCRSRSATRYLLAFHGRYQQLTEVLLTALKSGLRRLKQRTRPSPKQDKPKA